MAWNQTPAAGAALVPFRAIAGTNASELPVKAPTLTAAASWTGSTSEPTRPAASTKNLHRQMALYSATLEGLTPRRVIVF
jgi:hypothetical protein